MSLEPRAVEILEFWFGPAPHASRDVWFRKNPAFDAEIEPLFRTPLVRLLSRHPFILYSLGIPPSQFASLVEASSGNLARL